MSKMNEYDSGDTVTMRVDFKVDTTLSDPTTVALTVTDPSGDSTEYTYAEAEVTKDGTGEYSKSLAVSESGEWSYTWTGAGALVASGTRRFSVRRQGA